MTLTEMAVEYREHARLLRERIKALESEKKEMEEGPRLALEGRIRMLETMWREARDQAVLLERYYERGYRRNAKYTI